MRVEISWTFSWKKPFWRLLVTFFYLLDASYANQNNANNNSPVPIRGTGCLYSSLSRWLLMTVIDATAVSNNAVALNWMTWCDSCRGGWTPTPQHFNLNSLPHMVTKHTYMFNSIQFNIWLIVIIMCNTVSQRAESEARAVIWVRWRGASKKNMGKIIGLKIPHKRGKQRTTEYQCLLADQPSSVTKSTVEAKKLRYSNYYNHLTASFPGQPG